MKIQPQGKMIIVEPIQKEAEETKSGIQIVDKTNLGKIVELSEEFKDVYKKGDVVAFSEGAGSGVFYNGKACLYLNGNGFPNGDVWAIVTTDKK